MFVNICSFVCVCLRIYLSRCAVRSVPHHPSALYPVSAGSTDWHLLYPYRNSFKNQVRQWPGARIVVSEMGAGFPVCECALKHLSYLLCSRPNWNEKSKQASWEKVSKTEGAIRWLETLPKTNGRRSQRAAIPLVAARPRNSDGMVTSIAELASRC